MSQPASGYGRLARQVTDWTTKALFSALVLVGGIGFGRQVLYWWHGEDTSVSAKLEAASPHLSDPSMPIDVALGDSPMRIVRQTVVGNQADAMRVLRAACRRHLNTASPWSEVADEDERNLLARLAEIEDPTKLETTGRRLSLGESTYFRGAKGDNGLYEPVPDMPLIVGTRRLTPANDDSLDATSPENRMVLWGLAVPAGTDEWTIFVFQSVGRGSESDKEKSIPLPPDCRRIMALGDGGVEVSAFQGSEACEEYHRFFARWQAEDRPQDEVQWRKADDGGWQASCIPRQSGGADSPSSFVIQLMPDRFGGCTGIVIVSRRGDVQ